jgi:MraZ protein
VAEFPTKIVEIEQPRGMFPAKIDERGRVKLPAVFKEYLDKFPENRLWVTSLDRAMGQIYPISIWKETEKFLDSYTDDPEVAARLAFNAADLGEETSLDSQGRLEIAKVGGNAARELQIEVGDRIDVLKP